MAWQISGRFMESCSGIAASLTTSAVRVCCDDLRQVRIRRTGVVLSLAPCCRMRRFRPERRSLPAEVPRVHLG
jgi:hypothetical protein